MGLTPQQSLNIKYRYYEVFDKNRQIMYGITSDEDKKKSRRNILASMCLMNLTYMTTTFGLKD